MAMDDVAKGPRTPSWWKRNDLMTIGSAAVLTVYSAGYFRTRDAAQRFAGEASQRHATALSTKGPSVHAIAPPARSGEGGARAPLPVHEAGGWARQAAAPKAGRPRPPSPTPRISRVAGRRRLGHGDRERERTCRRDCRNGRCHASCRVARDASPSTSASPVDPPAPQPAAAAPAPDSAAGTAQKKDEADQLKDGVFYGWGTSRHGDIQASVEIKNGKIVGAYIAQCLTRYSCSWISDAAAGSRPAPEPRSRLRLGRDAEQQRLLLRGRRSAQTRRSERRRTSTPSPSMGTVVTIQVVGHGGRTPSERNATEASRARPQWFENVEACCSRFDPAQRVARSSRSGPAYAGRGQRDALRGRSGSRWRSPKRAAARSIPTVGARMEARGFDRQHRTGEIGTARGIAPDAGASPGATWCSTSDAQTITLLSAARARSRRGRQGPRRRHWPRANSRRSVISPIDAGGDLYLGGVELRTGQPWSVGIRHPRETRAHRDPARLRQRGLYVGRLRAPQSGRRGGSPHHGRALGRDRLRRSRA